MKTTLVPINPRRPKLLCDSDSDDLELDIEEERTNQQIVPPFNYIQRQKLKIKQVANKENCMLLK